MKNALEEINSRLEGAEKWISDKVVKITKSEQQEEKEYI